VNATASSFSKGKKRIAFRIILLPLSTLYYPYRKYPLGGTTKSAFMADVVVVITQRFALAARGGGVYSPPKREKLEADAKAK
jgi:hypothetical protein